MGNNWRVMSYMICSDFCFRRKCLAVGELSRESREKHRNWEEAAVLAQGAGRTRAPRAGWHGVKQLDFGYILWINSFYIYFIP